MVVRKQMILSVLLKRSKNDPGQVQQLSSGLKALLYSRLLEAAR